jgi:two-component system, NtrC family, response regulator HydG
MASILLVDDDPRFLRLLESILTVSGYRVWKANSTDSAMQLGAQYYFDLLIASAPDVLAWFRRHSRETEVLSGIRRPLPNAEDVRVMVRRALDHRELRWMREESRVRHGFESLIAEDPKMSKAIARARKAAASGATVLLTGEAGTGKETLARCIHSASARARRGFASVDCAALASKEAEIELFGHETTPGRLERASGGTLFLKEANRLDAGLQAKLVRAVREKAFERTGTNRVALADVRLIGSGADRNGFDSGAYSIAIPPLRQRRADIQALAKFFLGRAKQGLSITQEALERLCDHDWPGNIRELKNMMERAAIACDCVVRVDDLPALGYRAGIPQPLTMAEIERRSIEEAVGAHGGNRTRAAAQLGISLRTIQYKMKEYGLAERSRNF